MQGKCNCGQIQFEILGEIPKLYQCHCSLCRRQSGASSNTAMIVVANNLRWLSGEDHISSWVDRSGFRSDFCAVCGSPVPNPLKGTSNYWVPAGLLDDAELEIGMHLFVGSKAAWDEVCSSGRQHETMPELATLFDVLNGKEPA